MERASAGGQDLSAHAAVSLRNYLPRIQSDLDGATWNHQGRHSPSRETGSAGDHSQRTESPRCCRNELDPTTIDWSQFKSGNIPYTLRQDPGPTNALGRVKLMFPNQYQVYLHDTPSQSLFERSDRAFSSGCVRVERALELAERVLDDPERWNRDSIAQVIAAGQLQN